MVDASLVLKEAVDVLSGPDRGASIVASGHVSSRVATWRMRVASSRLEFVRIPLVLLCDISAATISGS